MLDLVQLVTRPIVVVAVVSFVNVVLQTLISKKFTDPNKLKQYSEELKEYTAALEAAKKSKDKKLLKQLEKRKKYISTLESEIRRSTTYQLIVSLILSLAVFYLLSYLFKPGEPIAFISTYLIWPPSEIVKLDFILWFIISSFFFSIVVRKIFGLS